MPSDMPVQPPARKAAAAAKVVRSTHPISSALLCGSFAGPAPAPPLSSGGLAHHLLRSLQGLDQADAALLAQLRNAELVILPDGSSGLHAAAMTGHAALIKCLLAAGAGVHVNAREQSGRAPLHVAAAAGSAAAVVALLEGGASVDAVAGGSTALHLAGGQGLGWQGKRTSIHGEQRHRIGSPAARCAAPALCCALQHTSCARLPPLCT